MRLEKVFNIIEPDKSKIKFNTKGDTSNECLLGLLHNINEHIYHHYRYLNFRLNPNSTEDFIYFQLLMNGRTHTAEFFVKHRPELLDLSRPYLDLLTINLEDEALKD